MIFQIACCQQECLLCIEFLNNKGKMPDINKFKYFIKLILYIKAESVINPKVML